VSLKLQTVAYVFASFVPRLKQQQQQQQQQQPYSFRFNRTCYDFTEGFARLDDGFPAASDLLRLDTTTDGCGEHTHNNQAGATT
jgi:hypothetical protein